MTQGARLDVEGRFAPCLPVPQSLCTLDDVRDHRPPLGQEADGRQVNTLGGDTS